MRNNQRGYSFLELLLSMAVGSIIIAGSYVSYSIVGKQYARNIAIAETQEAGIAALRILSRDIRMAGYEALDTSTLEAPLGAITTPIDITDSGNACCDSVEIQYDVSTSERKRITYSIAPRTNPARNALYMDIETWDGATWTTETSDAIVVDYIDDFQLEGSDLNSDGNPALIDVSLIMRSKTARSKEIQYDKNDYDIGNYSISVNDLFHRDEFNATINVRNLRE